MNEVSPGNVPTHTQLAISLFHAFEYMEGENPLPQVPLASMSLVRFDSDHSWSSLEFRVQRHCEV